jgi:hypothetical protein
MRAAAHVPDLAAAANERLRTAFIERPEEFGPARVDKVGTPRSTMERLESRRLPPGWVPEVPRGQL